MFDKPLAMEIIDSLPTLTLRDQTDLCLVCQSELTGQVTVLPCLHKYHTDCLMPWFEQRDTCPTCKQVVQPDSDCSFQSDQLLEQV